MLSKYMRPKDANANRTCKENSIHAISVTTYPPQIILVTYRGE